MLYYVYVCMVQGAYRSAPPAQTAHADEYPKGVVHRMASGYPHQEKSSSPDDVCVLLWGVYAYVCSRYSQSTQSMDVALDRPRHRLPGGYSLCLGLSNDTSAPPWPTVWYQGATVCIGCLQFLSLVLAENFLKFSPKRLLAYVSSGTRGKIQNWEFFGQKV